MTRIVWAATGLLLCDVGWGELGVLRAQGTDEQRVGEPVEFAERPALTNGAFVEDVRLTALEAEVAVAAPMCRIVGPEVICPNTAAAYAVESSSSTNGILYQWSLADDTSGAAILGAADGAMIRVQSGSGGGFTLTLLTSNGQETATCRLGVDVADQTGPEIIRPTNLILPCEYIDGSDVKLPVTAIDGCDGTVPVVCVPPAGGFFPPGVTMVNCSATDSSSNRTEIGFTVLVRDSVPPQMDCPSDLFVAEDPPGSGQGQATFQTPLATDACDPNPAVTCSMPSGTTLAVGLYVITCWAVDGSGNTNTCAFVIRVVPHTLVISSTADLGPGTLRQALLDANGARGSNVIRFGFSGGAPYVIRLHSGLPAIVDPLVIDGWSQIEFRGLPVVELVGGAVTTRFTAARSPQDADGLVLVTSNSVIRGMAINGFAVGIRIQGGGRNTLEGNFIGTDTTGLLAMSNLEHGIQISSPNNRIGGLETVARNVVSANGGAGIVLETSAAANNLIQGNLIGVGSDGATEMGNGQAGVRIRDGSARNRIAVGNTIAFNDGDGVRLDSSAGDGNVIQGNSIRSNAGLGIDLGGDGMTTNDSGDADSGPNQLQNFPILTRAWTVGNVTKIEGYLEGVASGVYDMEFFRCTTLNGLDVGEGEVVLGWARVQTGTNGIAVLQVELPVGIEPNQSITATATDAGDNTSEFSPSVNVGSAPFILEQPTGTNVPPDAPVSLCVIAGGSEPLSFQWRHNGANIPDATNACFALEAVELEDGGSYSVVVANAYDAVLSEEVRLTLDIRVLPAGDNFADRLLLRQTNGSASGNNLGATREPGESDHLGKPGGKSVWYKWMAPATGIARFRTTGSTFDTLLAIYEGTTVTNLFVAGNDEDSGGFFTSDIRFNVYAGVEYQIAVDGYGGQEGAFVFTWEFEATEVLLPLIHVPPQSRTVAPGGSWTFSVVASPPCPEGTPECRNPEGHYYTNPPNDQGRLAYQWYLNGRPIPGATNANLVRTGAEEGDLGLYTVRVREGNREVESPPVSLQFNLTGGVVQNVQATDKFHDAERAPVQLRLGDGGSAQGAFDRSATRGASVVRGYTGTQVFSTAGSSTELAEEPICGVIGGASQWISIITEEAGELHLNTDGSTYDTVVAVFVRTATNANVLKLLGCDNDSGLDRKDSSLAVVAQAGRTNFVVIDGVGGATGTLQLNFSLVTPAVLLNRGRSAAGNYRLRVLGHPDMRFTVQASSNFLNWSSLVTTSSVSGVFDFVDRTSSEVPARCYRALMLP